MENGARVVWREGGGVVVEEDLGVDGVDGDMVVVVAKVKDEETERDQCDFGVASGHVDTTFVVPIGGEGQICAVLTMSSNVQNKRTGEQAALYAEYLVEEEKSWAYALCHVRIQTFQI